MDVLATLPFCTALTDFIGTTVLFTALKPFIGNLQLFLAAFFTALTAFIGNLEFPDARDFTGAQALDTFFITFMDNFDLLAFWAVFTMVLQISSTVVQ